MTDEYTIRPADEEAALELIGGKPLVCNEKPRVAPG
jgi:hypothetical protein